MQAAPLETKILMTKSRIREWIREFGEDGAYVSFSGGKDSTVLLDIVRQDYQNVPAVFCDTGLEYPEVREFVKTVDNVTWIKPSMTFRQVIEKCGYPMISKEVSECVYGARRYLDSVRTGEERISLEELKQLADAKSVITCSGGGTKTSTEDSTDTVRMPREFPQRWRQVRGIAEYCGRTGQRKSTKITEHPSEKGRQSNDGDYP